MFQSRRQLERKEETRAALLEAARRLFGEGAYDEVTLRLVAREAGRTASSITRLYGTKERLWSAAMGGAPPRDRPTVRHADKVQATLQALVAACRDGDATQRETVLVAAERLLDAIQADRSDR